MTSMRAQSNSQVTRAQFNRTVKQFELTHGLALKELLDEKAHPEIAKIFWNDPTIRAYLTRSTITFVDKHPSLRGKSEDDKDEETDCYELMLYEHFPHALLFRNKLITSSVFFYGGAGASDDGTFDDANVVHKYKKIFTELLKHHTQGSREIEIGYASDIYEIAKRTHNRFLLPEDPRFIVSANWKDDHATTCLTILDPATGRVLITLFLNSWRDDSYCEYMKDRYTQSESYSLMRYDDAWVNQFDSGNIDTKWLIEYIKTTFSIDLNDRSLFTSSIEQVVNERIRAAIVICRNSRLPLGDIDAYIKLAKRSDIDMIFIYNVDTLSLSIRHFPKTFFMDVSHDLQDDEDKNCSLYTFNFSKAIVTLLQQPDKAAEVLQLARLVAHHVSDTDELKNEKSEAAAKLKHIFQENLKTYLPHYYDENGKRRSKEELEAFHLQQRWDMGSQSLHMLHPLVVPAEAKSDRASSRRCRFC